MPGKSAAGLYYGGHFLADSHRKWRLSSHSEALRTPVMPSWG